eukprot:COSAG01_NODE_24282_length_784_cov_1.065693_1_plen_97_part_00
MDTIADFIEQNNPEGLTGSEWKEKYYMEALGMQDSVWCERDLLQDSVLTGRCVDLLSRLSCMSTGLGKTCPGTRRPSLAASGSVRQAFPTFAVHFG